MYRSYAKNVDPRALCRIVDRVVSSYTRAGLLFTSLDVSNAVKHTLPAARHRDVAPLVRERFLWGSMGEYVRTMIPVLAGGTTPAEAYLYHPPRAPTEYYNEQMRSQLATPPSIDWG